MQTFLPYPNFAQSVKVLDTQRLGKQRVETLQIMNALVSNKGWIHHPATKMWRGYEWALLQYQEATVAEWLSRGYTDTCLAKTRDLYYSNALPCIIDNEFPDWLGDEAFHTSHQSNLIRKDPDFYGPLFPNVPNDLPYVWPTPKSSGAIMVSMNSLVHENARLMFRNFAGREAPFNAAGDRNFVMFLEPSKAEEMKAEGWNIKYLKPREEDDEPQAYLGVAVSFKTRPPKIVVITSKARTEFDEASLPMLDYAEIKNADIMLSAYEWEVNGNTGIKAYLKSAFITLNEDPLELKYAEDPTTQSPAMSSTASEED